jgi:biopolymer transport protein ExbD
MLFFLLVFFVLTSSFTRETGIDINKPNASSARSLPRQPLLIGVTKDGSIHVNESPVSLKALGAVLKHYMAEDPDRAVVIVADRDASIAKAVDVLDECNLANVKKVSISSLKE